MKDAGHLKYKYTVGNMYRVLIVIASGILFSNRYTLRD